MFLAVYVANTFSNVMMQFWIVTLKAVGGTSGISYGISSWIPFVVHYLHIQRYMRSEYVCVNLVNDKRFSLYTFKAINNTFFPAYLSTSTNKINI